MSVRRLPTSLVRENTRQIAVAAVLTIAGVGATLLAISGVLQPIGL